MAQPKSDFLPGIQYLSGFAALYVVIYHLNGDFAFPLLAYGYLGVQLFFVISGFIITHVHGQDRGPDKLRRFFVRRFTRIYPVYWVALLPVLLLFLLLPEKGLAWHSDPVNIIRNFLLHRRWPWLLLWGGKSDTGLDKIVWGTTPPAGCRQSFLVYR